jgi:hypothetical protein
MKPRVLFLSIFLCAFLMQLAYSQLTTVRFYLDMNGQIDKGNFAVGIDTVDVAGDFNGWEVSADTLVHIGNGIYMISYVDLFYIGDTLEYKFRINSNWGTSEFLNGQPNRKYVVQSFDDSVYHFYGDYIINANLLAFFPFDGNANDESGRDHNGTVIGASLDANRFGKPDSSYYFNGTDNYI